MLYSATSLVMGYHELNKSTLLNDLTMVAHNGLTTDKPVAFRFLIELKFGNVRFCRGSETRKPGEKPSEQGREPITNSTHMTPGKRALPPQRHPGQLAEEYNSSAN